jgi:hypothetical protein
MGDAETVLTVLVALAGAKLPPPLAANIKGPQGIWLKRIAVKTRSFFTVW